MIFRKNKTKILGEIDLIPNALMTFIYITLCLL